jgi:hypothetical protein
VQRVECIQVEQQEGRWTELELIDQFSKIRSDEDKSITPLDKNTFADISSLILLKACEADASIMGTETSDTRMISESEKAAGEIMSNALSHRYTKEKNGERLVSLPFRWRSQGVHVTVKAKVRKQFQHKLTEDSQNGIGDLKERFLSA